MSKIYNIQNHTIRLKNGDMHNVNTYTTHSKNGFSHHAVASDAFFKGEQVRARCTYINRTWEKYEYESVLNTLKAKIENLKKKGYSKNNE